MTWGSGSAATSRRIVLIWLIRARVEVCCRWTTYALSCVPSTSRTACRRPRCSSPASRGSAVFTALLIGNLESRAVPYRPPDRPAMLAPNVEYMPSSWPRYAGMSTRPDRTWPLSTSWSSTTSGFQEARVLASRSSCTLPSGPCADSMLKETTVSSVRPPGTQVWPEALGNGADVGADGGADVGADVAPAVGTEALGPPGTTGLLPDPEPPPARP